MTTLSPDKRKLAVVGFAVVLIASGAGLWFWFAQSEAARHRADPEDLQLVALGEPIYRFNCAACHGAQLEGQPNWRERKPDGKLPAPPHDETGHTWHHADDQLFRLTKIGVKPPLAPEGYQSDMPAFDGVLADAQIWAVLAFIKSKWPLDIRDRQERINEAIRRQQAEIWEIKK
jgi:mono/diheme cytochrome c family protein